MMYMYMYMYCKLYRLMKAAKLKYVYMLNNKN